MNFLIFFFISNILFSDNNPYSNFTSFMKSQDGVVFDIYFHQGQYGENLSSYGKILLEPSEKITFDNESIRIVYNDSIIKTVNKKTKQIIYDNRIVEEITVFDLLYGTKSSVVPYKVTKNGNTSTIFFEITDFSMRGNLDIVAVTGEPTKITLYDNFNNKTFIDIKKSVVKRDVLKSIIDTTFYEIIDLRE